MISSFQQVQKKPQMQFSSVPDFKDYTHTKNIKESKECDKLCLQKLWPLWCLMAKCECLPFIRACQACHHLTEITTALCLSCAKHGFYILCIQAMDRGLGEIQDLSLTYSLPWRCQQQKKDFLVTCKYSQNIQKICFQGTTTASPETLQCKVKLVYCSRLGNALFLMR